MPDPIASPSPQPAYPLPIEETPEIPMDIPDEPQSQVPAPAPMPTVPRGSMVPTILIVIIFFVAGVFLSQYIRPLLTGESKVAVTITPTPAQKQETPTRVEDPLAGWKPVTFAGVSYQLPPDVALPACDAGGCMSQGTYLPGGTRLTISSKNVSPSLISLRGVVVTDASGMAFNSRDASISGHMAVEFTGTFPGRTTGGFGFTQMHGFMIETSPTTTLEINHFTPTGVTANFTADDALFTQIISSLSFTTAVTVPAIVTATPSAATSSAN